MAIATFNRFNIFLADAMNKKHNLGADTIKLALTDTAPVAANTVLADITEIAATGGYAAGGYTVTTTSSAQVAGLYRLILVDNVITATGAALPQFRYCVLYNSTAAAGPLIGWYDYGSEVNIPITLTFTVDFDGTNGVFSIP